MLLCGGALEPGESLRRLLCVCDTRSYRRDIVDFIVVHRIRLDAKSLRLLFLGPTNAVDGKGGVRTTQ